MTTFAFGSLSIFDVYDSIKLDFSFADFKSFFLNFTLSALSALCLCRAEINNIDITCTQLF